MQDRHAEKLKRLVESVLDGPGEAEPTLRRAAADGAEVPEALTGYRDKVARHAYKVVDRDVQDLLAAGYTEDQIFELTVSTALGAAMMRLQRGMKALEEGDAE